MDIEIVSAERPENDSHEATILRLYNSLKTPVGSESIYDWMLRVDQSVQSLREENKLLRKIINETVRLIDVMNIEGGEQMLNEIRAEFFAR